MSRKVDVYTCAAARLLHRLAFHMGTSEFVNLTYISYPSFARNQMTCVDRQCLLQLTEADLAWAVSQLI